MLNQRHCSSGGGSVTPVVALPRSPRRLFGRSSRLPLRLRRLCVRCCYPTTLVSALRKESVAARTEREQQLLETVMCSLFGVLCVTLVLFMVCLVQYTLTVPSAGLAELAAGEENYVAEERPIVSLMRVFGMGRLVQGDGPPSHQPRAMRATERLFERLLYTGDVDRLVGLYSRQGLAPHTARNLRRVDALIDLLRRHDGNVTRRRTKKAHNASVMLIPQLAHYLMQARLNRTSYRHAEHSSHDSTPHDDYEAALPPVDIATRAGLDHGFVAATPSTPEQEQLAPFSDVMMLIYRHALLNNSLTLPAEELRALYGASSVFNNRFYYPARRWQRAQPYVAAGKADNELWYSAVLEEARQLFPDTTITSYTLPMMPSDINEAVYKEAQTFFADAKLAPLPHASVEDDRASIFVNFASYRDPECSNTLTDLYSKAKSAYRVFVGVAQQNAVVDSPCIDARLLRPMPCYQPRAGGTGGDVAEDFTRGVCFVYDNIRVRRIRSSKAYGPTYGRYMAMLLYHGEDYILSIDSHNRFMPFWDAALLRMHHKYDDPKAVLSHYPLAWEPTKSTSLLRPMTAYLCRCHFQRDYGYVRLDAIVVHDAVKYAANNRYNDPYTAVQHDAIVASQNFRLPQPWVAGGFMFANASFQRAVPYDPHLPHTFDGEEVLLSVRLWTHGYNIYSPERSVLFHFYIRQKAPKVWNDSPLWWTIQQQSRQRIQYLLRVRRKPNDVLLFPRNTTLPHIVVDLDRYSMGKERTVQQWYNYAGLDPIRERLTKKWC